jgi:AraC-like DNA-binding protein
MIHDIYEDFYATLLTDCGFSPAAHIPPYGPSGLCWKLSEAVGDGYYWIYSQKNLFDIRIHDFSFHEDSFMEFNMPECLSITHFESISGEELSPYGRLNAGCVKALINGYEPYRVLIHKEIPIRATSVEIMPAYYEDYLQKQYPGVYEHPREAFVKLGQTMAFPQMARLLNQVKTYQGNGISAKLFYEGKVAEAVSLVIERQRTSGTAPSVSLSGQDIRHLDNAAAYINDHYAHDIPLERISKIACMGATKFKSTFRRYHGCTVTEYLHQRRMSQAEHLLSDTDLTIGQIAQTVGYSCASRFSVLFRRSTGILPGEYRKMAQRK